MKVLRPWDEWVADLEEFCQGDRRQGLEKRLTLLPYPSELWRAGEGHHFHLRLPFGTGVPLIFVAHYDAVPGSPGANDNGASVFHLLEFLRRVTETSRPVHILFTDKEELSPGQGFRDQGIYQLGDRIQKAGIDQGLFVVLDMTGIGDTLILSRGSAHTLQSQNHKFEGPLLDRFKKNRVFALRILSSLEPRGIMELPTPFSDDLGLLALGIPGVQISLLPRKQALQWKKAPDKWPLVWSTMHSPRDSVDTLEKESYEKMARFLNHLAVSPVI